MTNFRPIPRWHYWTHPNSAWMESFVSHLVSPDIVMWAEETDSVPAWFAWSSNHFDDVGSPKEFVDRSTSLKALFDGAMFIASGPSYYPIELVNPSAEEAADRSMVSGLPYPGDVGVEPFSRTYLNVRHGLDDHYLDDPLTRSLFLARYDDVTRAILKYTGVQGLTYLSLYAYRDWMKDAGWDDAKIAREAGWSAAKLKDFTNTANNPAYLGPYCRHGGHKTPLPKRPLPLAEADVGMRKAMRSFLLHRANLFDLRREWNLLK